ncbi:MAG: T9SS type A sorting domain-containing protein [Bacteroidia bacterium]|nr:T9SS type A sorting domain-containing protein [Bacteroidia bacterium]
MKIHPKLRFTIFLLCPLFFTGIKVLAQPGCTDPQAQNYDAAATLNDGSCIYATTDISIPPVNPLDLQLSESSGLAFFNGRLWSHNDSGSWPLFYALDTLTGQVVQTFYVRNEIQTDWEDICTGNGYLYIGDFGNNAGNRTDLRILRIDIDSIGNAVQDTVAAESIHFIYEDQTDFSGTNTTHNFDCEAMFFRDDSLHLFSRNGSNGYTKHYVLPAVPGTHIARLCDSLYVQGQVTSADISGDSLIVLIGYQPPLYVPFAVLLWDYAGNSLFSGNKRRLTLGSVLAMGQQEGVCFRGACDGFISAEAVGQLNLPARFFRFNFSRFFEQPLALEEVVEKSKLHVYPNPFTDQVQLQTAPGTCIRNLELTDMNGKTLRRIMPQQNETIQLNGLGGLSPGMYILRSESCSGRIHMIKIQK